VAAPFENSPKCSKEDSEPASEWGGGETPWPCTCNYSSVLHPEPVIA